MVGQAIVLEGESPHYDYRCVFEDDGETGYFYAVDPESAEQPIVDALHIYDVGRGAQSSRPLLVQIVWSADGLNAALFIDNYPHAIFDFERQRGYCRTGFPSPSKWATNDHAWDERALDLLAD
jgi:hypothetical protein